MSDSNALPGLIAASLAQHFERVKQKIHALVEPLSEEQFWRRPYGYGNSPGHLLLHLTGNLSYYIGAQIAGTGYVRKRPLEFTDVAKRPKAEVLGALDAAVAMVLITAAAQTADSWRAPFEGVGVDDLKDRFSMFLRCAAHFDHHTGQLIYLSKELQGPVKP